MNEKLKNKAISIMKEEDSFRKFKRYMRKGKAEQMTIMMEDIIERYDLKDDE